VSVDPVFLGLQQSCPSCGGNISLSQGKRPPQPGDPTLCVHCMSVLAFTESGLLRRVPHEEVLTWSPDLRRQIADGILHLKALKRQLHNKH
jgi:hypothetical protein